MRRVLPLAIALAIGGCKVGPDFEQPPAPTDTGYTPEPLAAQTVSARTRSGTTQRFVPAHDMPGEWWTLFRSALLGRHRRSPAPGAVRPVRHPGWDWSATPVRSAG